MRLAAAPALVLLAVLTLPALSGAQTFSDGTLSVVTIGDGVDAPLNGGSQVTLRNYAKTGTNQGTPAASSLLPVFLGPSISEGQLQADGSDPRNLYLGGFSRAVALGNVADTTGTEVPRRVTRFDTRTRTATSTDLATDDYSETRIVSAQVVGTTILTAGFSASGGQGGVLTGTFGGASTNLAQGVTTGGVYFAKNLGGTTYYTPGFTIYTGPNETGSIFAGETGIRTVISGFLFTSPDTLYLSTNGLGLGGSGGGLFRATRGAGGKFETPVQIYSGASLLALATDGTRLFATTFNPWTSRSTDNALLSLDLNGGDVQTLATAGANRAFRGVEVVAAAPVPEPATLAALGLGALALLKRRRKLA